MKTQLYRHFDKNDQLLYVGISLSTVTRLSQHKDSSSWYEQIARVTIENYETREEALIAETNAIQSENPKYNIMKTNVVIKEKEKRAAELRSYIEEARSEITKNVVHFDMIYKLEELDSILKLGRTKIKKLIDDGHLQSVVYERQGQGKYSSRTIKKYYVTGWHLIDFIENCQMTGLIP